MSTTKNMARKNAAGMNAVCSIFKCTLNLHSSTQHLCGQNFSGSLSFYLTEALI